MFPEPPIAAFTELTSILTSIAPEPPILALKLFIIDSH